jgi:hypothetical protein
MDREPVAILAAPRGDPERVEDSSGLSIDQP